MKYGRMVYTLNVGSLGWELILCSRFSLVMIPDALHACISNCQADCPYIAELFLLYKGLFTILFNNFNNNFTDNRSHSSSV